MRLSRRKLPQPKATAEIPKTLAIVLNDVDRVLYFADAKPAKGVKTSRIAEAHKKLELTEYELVARGFAESRSVTIEDFVRKAVLALAKASVMNASRSSTDYAPAYARLVKAGMKITPSRLAAESGGNLRTAIAWLAKNGGSTNESAT